MAEYIFSAVCGDVQGYSIPIASGLPKDRIIRCCDCMYYAIDPEPVDHNWPMMCELSGLQMIRVYGYCAWAERRDGGEDDENRQ